MPERGVKFAGRCAEITIADLTSSGAHDGFACLISAATPATLGEEKLVPLLKPKPDRSNEV
jgi:hypothetical protein